MRFTKSVMLIGFSLLFGLGCSSPPVKFEWPTPYTILVHDLEPGRSWSTPLQNSVCLAWHGVLDERIQFELYNPRKSFFSSREYYLEPASAGVGDQLPFQIGNDKFNLDLLAVGITKEVAREKYALPHYDSRFYDTYKKFSVIRISRRP